MRSCAKESGSSPFRGTGTSGGTRALSGPRRAASTAEARPATVGASNNRCSGSSTPRAVRTRETTWVASREWPPSAKKSSRTPTRSIRSTSAQMPASSSSTGPPGAT